VKNICLAIQMYLADYDDTLPPTEHRQEAEDFFVTCPGGGRTPPEEDCNHKHHANPFLRWPVIFDPYVRNRDVWRCPSAYLVGGARWIIPNHHPGGWLQYLIDTQGQWGTGDLYPGPCSVAWPPGWGGTVTDSIAQGNILAVEGTSGTEDAFVQSIATTLWPEMKMGWVDNPAWFIIAGDGGAQTDNLGIGICAFPDVCFAECAGPGCSMPDWSNCPWSTECSFTGETKQDPQERMAHTRHLGGVNLGFLDGHARWFTAEWILSEAPRGPCGCWDYPYVWGQYEGIDPWGPTSAAGSPADGVDAGTCFSADCGVPCLY
jgi:prepilin-type processing-associated H-X9-DG protein